MVLLRYILQRVASYVVVLFIGITITFFLPRLMPSNPIDNYISQVQSRAGQTLTPEAAQELRSSLEELYGLKGSIGTQYLNYLNRVVLHFDFGPSFTSYPEPVSKIIFAALPWTAGLLLTTTILSWLLGNLVGLIAGYFNKNVGAIALEIVGVIIYPIPYYILALTVIYVLAYSLQLFPLTPTWQIDQISVNQIGMIFTNAFLPALTLVLAGFGWNILSMKALAVQTKEEPFVTFARLKGTPDWTRMNRYVFRNALLPQISALVLSLGFIFNGALITEVLFSFPGVGLLMRTAAGAGDYNLLYGAITISIIAVATAALALDLLYPLFDPRIRLS